MDPPWKRGGDGERFPTSSAEDLVSRHEAEEGAVLDAVVTGDDDLAAGVGPFRERLPVVVILAVAVGGQPRVARCLRGDRVLTRGDECAAARHPQRRAIDLPRERGVAGEDVEPARA